MTKISRTFLIVSVVALLASFTDAGSAIGFGIAKPLGAVFFILFFISHVLSREVALFDEEQRARQPVTVKPAATANAPATAASSGKDRRWAAALR